MESLCQKWTSQSPHVHNLTPEKVPNAGLVDHNFCRNPDGEPQIWCWIDSTEGAKWAFCNPLPKCKQNLYKLFFFVCLFVSSKISCEKFLILA